MTSALPAAHITPLPEVCESSLEDLAIQRYLLDLALQPIESFEGFTRIEQVGPSALRYQLNHICYALALAQYTRTPAFTGYLAEAQRNSILKMCDRRVWSYWAYESLIGYLRWNTDPIAHHNVMYSGFFGVMLGLYETLNDDVFSSPGSLALRWSTKICHDYDYAKLAGAIRSNMLASPQTQYPCEPHLIYPMCNTFALNALRMHDRLHTTELTGDLIERVCESHTRDGYLRPNGRFLGGRGPFGLKISPAIGNDMVISYWLHALMPERARHTWDVVRENVIAMIDTDCTQGRQRKLAFGDRVDPGNYSFSTIFARVLSMATAREMGDEALAQKLENNLENTVSIARHEGARHFERASTWTNTAYALARFGRVNGMRDLLDGVVPEAWKNGPQLSAAAYPDVLVAYAVSHDGKGLELVLRPGNGACRTTLGISRLAANARYTVSGALNDELHADAQGNALLDILLTDRLELCLRPA